MRRRSGLKLRERKVDVLISFWLPAAGEHDLNAEILYKAFYTVVAGHRHPVIRGKQSSLSDLTDELWAFRPSDSSPQQRWIEDLFRRRKLKLPQATVTTLSYYMILNLLATGRFLSVLPFTMLQHPSHKAWLRPVPLERVEPAGAVIAAITLKKRRLGGAVKLFVDESRFVCKHTRWGN